MADEEAGGRGRKRARPIKTGDSDEEMDDKMDERNESRKKNGLKGRSATPSQRSITAKKMVRDKSSGRREGNVPARLPYKLVPEE
jgi:hypothetical protein